MKVECWKVGCIAGRGTDWTDFTSSALPYAATFSGATRTRVAV